MVKNEEYSNKLLQKKINLAIRWAIELSDIDQNAHTTSNFVETGGNISLSSQQKAILKKIKVEFENLQQKVHGTRTEKDTRELSLSPPSSNNDELAQEVQSIIFNSAKSNNIQPKEVFRLFYQILINSERGPRLGNYIADLGLQNVIATLEKKIS